MDPFITGNPMTDLKVDEVQTDWILITHGHADHIGDMLPIAKNNEATIISIVEIADYAQQQGANSFGMNIGGKGSFLLAQSNLSMHSIVQVLKSMVFRVIWASLVVL